MVKHRNRQAPNHSPCPTCNGAPPLIQREHLPAPECNPCFSAGDDLFLTGSLILLTSLGPLFRSELPMDRANLLVPQCRFLTRCLAPLAVFPDLHPSRAASPSPHVHVHVHVHVPYRTLCSAVRYLVYIPSPYLSPRLSIVLAASASFNPWPSFVSSCLALSRPV